MKTRCVKAARNPFVTAHSEHLYDVQVQNAARQKWVTVGAVMRFGSLPSMRGWCSTAGDGWTRKRQTRAAAVKDLIAELAIRHAAEPLTDGKCIWCGQPVTAELHGRP